MWSEIIISVLFSLPLALILLNLLLTIIGISSHRSVNHNLYNKDFWKSVKDYFAIYKVLMSPRFTKAFLSDVNYTHNGKVIACDSYYWTLDVKDSNTCCIIKRMKLFGSNSITLVYYMRKGSSGEFPEPVEFKVREEGDFFRMFLYKNYIKKLKQIEYEKIPNSNLTQVLVDELNKGLKFERRKENLEKLIG